MMMPTQQLQHHNYTTTATTPHLQHHNSSTAPTSSHLPNHIYDNTAPAPHLQHHTYSTTPPAQTATAPLREATASRCHRQYHSVRPLHWIPVLLINQFSASHPTLSKRFVLGDNKVSCPVLYRFPFPFRFRSVSVPFPFRFRSVPNVLPAGPTCKCGYLSLWGGVHLWTSPPSMLLVHFSDCRVGLCPNRFPFHASIATWREALGWIGGGATTPCLCEPLVGKLAGLNRTRGITPPRKCG
jgi:hypothetical protein